MLSLKQLQTKIGQWWEEANKPRVKFLPFREDKNLPSAIIPYGINLRSDDELSPYVLSEVLVKTVNFLQSIELPEVRLQEYADWLEHNGWAIWDKGILDFAMLFKMVESPATLLKAMSKDDWVFVGIAPPDFSWYLRFSLDIESTKAGEDSGVFDLTLGEELVEQYKASVVIPLGMEMQEQDADKFFQSIFDRHRN